MAFFKRPVVLVVIAVALLACAIWFAGPKFAFADYRPLASVRGRWIGIGLVVAAGLLWLLVRRLRSGGVADALKALAPSREAPPPNREVVQVRERFEEAVARLSTPYRRHAAHRLYDLPWYVVIGLPGSGKTTAIHNSGLTFAREGAGTSPARRIGGTRYCEWLFADDAVFIDTAGRYTSQDEGDDSGTAGWTEFLSLLRRHRSRRPLNGVVVTVSAEDLLTQGDAGRETHVSAIQGRLQELNRELHVQVPVYLIVTKCDLLSGFVEYFDDLNADQRRQVWGVTFPIERTMAGDAARELPAGLDGLIERLNGRALPRVDDEREVGRRPKIFAFPQQVAALRAPLIGFVSDVFSATRFERRILLRGVYLTSSTQDGTPVDLASGPMARHLAGAAEVPPAGRRKAYFVERLIKEIVLSEAGLARVKRRIEMRHAARQLGAYAALLLLVAVGVLALSASYRRNRAYVDGLHATVRSLRSLPAAGPSLESVVPRLDLVRAVADAAGVDQQRRWTLGWGLNQGGLGHAARDAYARELSAALLPRVATRLRDRLAEYAGQPERLYEYLKAYVMLGRPEHHDARQLRFIAEMEWQSDGSPQGRALFKHVAALLDRATPLPPVQLDDALVAQARSTIRQASIPGLIYRQIRLTSAGDTVRALRLDLAAGVGIERVLRRRSGVPLSQPVPALYTPAVFKDIATRDTEQFVRQFTAEQWVWGAAGVPPVSTIQLAEDVVTLYEQDYIAVWDRIVNDLEPVSIASVAQAKEVLAVLSAPTSPLRGLLKTVDENTFLVKPADPAEPDKGIHERFVEMLKNGTKKAVPHIVPGSRVTGHFAAIHQLVNGQAGGAPIDAVLEKFKQIQQKLEPVGKGVGQTDPRDPAVVNGVGELVVALRRDAATLPPAVGSVVTAVANSAGRVTRSDLGGTVAARYQRVMQQCLEVTSGRYPFVANSTTDTPLKDFGRLFGHEGVFDSFFKQELEQLVETNGDSLRWRTDASGASVGPSSVMLRRFESAARIRRAFFKPGSQEPELRFRVTPVALDAAATRFVLEIDGQRFEYRHGPERPLAAVWPGPAPGVAAVSFEDATTVRPNLVFEGPWAWFRLFDVAERERDDVRFVLRYQLARHEARVVIDALSIHAASAMRELQAFRCGSDS